VHPQTVRYRMAQLNELFAGVLDDPRGRARLTLALVWQNPGRAVEPPATVADIETDDPVR